MGTSLWSPKMDCGYKDCKVCNEYNKPRIGKMRDESVYKR